MKSQQYEELCRYFLADKIGIDIKQIESVHIPNPRRSDLPEYKHQIDLYWETGTELSLYLHIANAKWRGSRKVTQTEMITLQQVKESIAAHKAMMLTNIGYTDGAIAVAKDKGIALQIVKPEFDVKHIPAKDRSAMQFVFQEISVSHQKPIYSFEVVHRAFDFAEVSNQARPTEASPIPHGYQTRVQTGHTTRVGGGGSNKAVTGGGRQIGTETRGGGNVTKGGGFIKR